jgi:HEAT repeat protein
MNPHQADIDVLSHRDPYIRAAAAGRLGEAQCAEALDALVATMNWRQDDVEDEIEGRCAAVIALGKLGDRRAIPSLMAFLESAFDAAIPSEANLICDAMIALAQLHADQALWFFERAVCTGDFEQVKAAMWCLRQYSSSEAVPFLLGVLADRSSPGPRGAAARTLGLIGDCRAQQLLITIIEDETEDEWLRYNAGEALGRIGGDGIFERLLLAFFDAHLNENVRRGVTKGLGYLGDPRAFDPLSEALASSEQPLRLVEALGNLRDHRAFATLIIHLQHPRREVVAASATALSELGDGNAIEPLQRARSRFGDDALDVSVKTAIDKALLKLSPDALAELRIGNAG